MRKYGIQLLNYHIKYEYIKISLAIFEKKNVLKSQELLSHSWYCRAVFCWNEVLLGQNFLLRVLD